MQLNEVLEAVVKDHPRVDWERRHLHDKMEFWSLCPCGFSTRHFKTKKSVEKEFRLHVVEEINIALRKNKILVRKGPAPLLPNR